MQRYLQPLILLLLFSSKAAFSQNLEVASLTSSLTKCGAAGSFSVEIVNNTGSQVDSIMLAVDMPQGFLISTQATSNADVTISNTSSQGFDLLVENLANQDTILIPYQVKSGCNPASSPTIQIAAIAPFPGSVPLNITSNSFTVTDGSFVGLSLVNPVASDSHSYSGNTGDNFRRLFKIKNPSAVNSFSGFVTFSDVFNSGIDIQNIEVLINGVLVDTSLYDFAITHTSVGSSNNGTVDLTLSVTNLPANGVITFREHVYIIQCVDGKGSSTVNINYNCLQTGNTCSATSPLSPQVTRDLSKGPAFAMNQDQNPASDYCFSDNNVRTRKYTYINSGTGPATNVNLNMYMFYRTILTLIKFNSIVVKKNGVVLDNSTFIKTEVEIIASNGGTLSFEPNAYRVSCFVGDTIIKNISIPVGTMLAGDSVSIQWDEVNCCFPEDAVESIRRFYGTQITGTYQGECGGVSNLPSLALELGDLGHAQEVYPHAKIMNGNPDKLPVPTMDIGQTQSFVSEGTVSYMNMYWNPATSFLDVDILASDGLTLTNTVSPATTFPIFMRFASDSGPIDWNAESVTAQTATSPVQEHYTARFRIANNPYFWSNGIFDQIKFNEYLGKVQVHFTLRAECVGADVATSFFKERLYLVQGKQTGDSTTSNNDAVCSEGCRILLSEVSEDLTVVCAGCVTPGWVINSVVAQRTTLGKQDNEGAAGDGIPDNNLTCDLCRKDFLTLYDEIKVTLVAHNFAGDSIAGFKTSQLEAQRGIILDETFLEMNLGAPGFTFLDAQAYMNDSTQSKSISSSYQAINDSLFVFHLDANDFGKTKFDGSEDLVIEANFRVTENIFSDASNINSKFHMFMSDSLLYPALDDAAVRFAATGDIDSVRTGSKYWCENNGAGMRYVPFYMENSYSAREEGCDKTFTVEATITPGKQFGEIINAFPYEFRDFGHLVTFNYTIPQGFKIHDAKIENSFGTRPGANSFVRINREVKHYASGLPLTGYLTSDSSFTFSPVYREIKPGDTRSSAYPPSLSVDTLHLGDEYINTKLILTLTPDCAVVPDTVLYGPAPNYPRPSVVLENLLDSTFTPVMPDNFFEVWRRWTKPGGVIEPIPVITSTDLFAGGGTVDFHVQLKNSPPQPNLPAEPTSNVYFGIRNIPQGFVIDSVKHGSDILTDTNGVYRVGNFSANQTETYDIYGHYTCGTGAGQPGLATEFTLISGWSCEGYPTAITDPACGQDSIVYTLRSGTVGLELIQDTINTSLCEDFEYRVKINSLGTGKQLNFDTRVILPEGIAYIGDPQVCSDTCITIASPTVSGDTLIFNDLNHPDYPDGIENGFPFDLIFTLHASCAYGTDAIQATATAETFCGTTVSDIALDVVPNIILPLDSLDSLVVTCNPNQGTLEVEMISTNTGSNTTINEHRLILTIPSGWEYTSSDSPVSFQDSTQVIWELPVLNAGQSSEVNAVLSPKAGAVFNICDTIVTTMAMVDEEVNVPCDTFTCQRTRIAAMDNCSSTIVPPFVFAGPDKNACFGVPVQIGISPVAGNIYSWSPSAGLSNDTIANPMATVDTTVSYVLTVMDSTESCVATDTVSINVVNVQLPEISGPTQLCAQDTGDFFIPISSSSYTLVSMPTGAQLLFQMPVPFWFPEAWLYRVKFGSEGGYLVFEATKNGCSRRDSVYVSVKPEGCCHDYAVNAGSTLSSPILGAKGQITTIDAANYGGTVTFDGNYLVKGILRLTNGNFNIESNSTLFVEPHSGFSGGSFCSSNTIASAGNYIFVTDSATLTITKATLTAVCDSMWRGIVVDSNSVIITDSATISDAYAAIALYPYCPTLPDVYYTNSDFSIKNTRFYNNDIALYDAHRTVITNITGMTNSEISTDTLKMKRWNKNKNPGTGIWGLGGNYSGVEFSNNYFHDLFRGIQLIADSVVIEGNIFENIYVEGVVLGYKTNAPLTIRNNAFIISSSQGPNYSIPPTVVAIRTGVGIANITGNNISATDSVPNRNRIGIWAQSSTPSFTASFNGLSGLDEGIRVTSTFANTHNILSNTINNCRYGIYVKENPFTSSLYHKIACNTFDGSGVTGPERAIFVEENAFLNNLGTSTNPNGNYFNGLSTDSCMVYDGTSYDNFRYFRYFSGQENLRVTSTIPGRPVPHPSGVVTTSYMADSNTCQGTPGINMKISANKDPLSMEDSISAMMDSLRFQLGDFRRMKEWQAEIIRYHRENNSLDKLEKYTEKLKGCNLEAYNTISLYLMHQYHLEGKCSRAHDCKLKVKSENPGDKEIEARTSYFEYRCRKSCGGHHDMPLVKMNVQDSTDLETIAASGTSVSEAACLELMLYGIHTPCDNKVTYNPIYPDCGEDCKREREQFLIRGWEKTTGFKADKTGGQLSQNIPNPAENETTIPYLIPVYEGAKVENAYIVIQNVLKGEEVKRIRLTETGWNMVTISLAGLPSGVYTYTLIVNDVKQDVKRMVVVQ